MAKLIRDVTETHRPAKRGCLGESHPQVSNQGLAGNQPLIGQDVPRTDQETALDDEFRDSLARARAHFQVVVENDRLAVEGEVASSSICDVGRVRRRFAATWRRRQFLQNECRRSALRLSGLKEESGIS